MKKISQDDLITHAIDQFNRSRNFRSERVEQRWKDSNDLYDGVFSVRKGDKEKSDVLQNQARLFIPKTYSHTQRMLVDIMETFFFDPEEIVSVGTYNGIPFEDREIVKNLLNYRLNGHPINFYNEAYEAGLDALKNKVGIFKVYPKIDYKTFDYMGEKLDVIWNFAPVMECIPFEDVFFDPRATWKDYYMFPIIHRFIRTRDYLKRKGYKNVDDLVAISIQTVNDEIKEQRLFDQGNIFAQEYSNRNRGLDSIMCYEIWTFMDVNGDGEYESCVYTAAGDGAGPRVIIRDVEENTLPYKQPGDEYNRPPIIVGNAFPEPHKMYGKDLPEIVEGLQRETNAQRNQRREAVALALRKPILANRNSGLDLMALVNRKIGSVVLGDDISDASVRELQISDPTMTTIQEQAKTDQDFYETTSIPPNLLGVASSGEETATAVTAHIYNANKKIGQVIRSLAYTLFLPAFKMLLRLEQEYETDEFIAFVTGKKLGWGFSADDMPPRTRIQGEFDLSVNLGVNKQTQLNKLMLIMDRANMVNSTIATMVQSQIIPISEAAFIDTPKIFDLMLNVLGEKDAREFKIQAMPPMMPSQEAPGVASQTGLPETPPESVVTNLNAEGMLSGE